MKGILLLFMLYVAIPCSAGKKLFSFIQYNDPHANTWTDNEAFIKFVDEVNAMAPHVDFVMVLGDVGADCCLATAKAILDNLNVPYYCVPGNHDPNMNSISQWRTVFGPENYTFIHKGVRIMMLDSNGPETWDKEIVNDTTLSFIDSVLAVTAPSTPIICGTHHAMHDSLHYHCVNAKEVVAKFSNHNLKAWLAGHYHGDAMVMENGVMFTTTEGLTAMDDYYGGDRGYRLVNVWEDSVAADKYRVTEPPTEFIPNDPTAGIAAGGFSGMNSGISLLVTPNPFNTRTKIAVSYPALAGSAVSNFSLKIFDINGKIVKDFSSSIYLPNGRRGIPRTFYLQAAGLSWDAAHLPGGMYILQATAGSYKLSRTLTLLR